MGYVSGGEPVDETVFPYALVFAAVVVVAFLGFLLFV